MNTERFVKRGRCDAADLIDLPSRDALDGVLRELHAAGVVLSFDDDREAADLPGPERDLKAYLSGLQTIPLLSRDAVRRLAATREVAELWLQCAEEREAGERSEQLRRWHDLLAEQLRRFVVAHARRRQQLGASVVELIEIGNRAAGRAAARYEWRRGYQLHTYAQWWISHAMDEELMQRHRGHDLSTRLVLAKMWLGRSPSSPLDTLIELGLELVRAAGEEAQDLDERLAISRRACALDTLYRALSRVDHLELAPRCEAIIQATLKELGPELRCHYCFGQNAVELSFLGGEPAESGLRRLQELLRDLPAGDWADSVRAGVLAFAVEQACRAGDEEQAVGFRAQLEEALPEGAPAQAARRGRLLGEADLHIALLRDDLELARRSYARLVQHSEGTCAARVSSALPWARRLLDRGLHAECVTVASEAGDEARMDDRLSRAAELYRIAVEASGAAGAEFQRLLDSLERRIAEVREQHGAAVTTVLASTP